ncbi:class I SAM-dependent methyltransferase [Afipia felis]|uniref:Uncharacterized protein conserved in bacteria n=2 Tax=Afipia felis TaxID=1035 RepID=A0A380W756_AFIFE|nr:class I SAM-dependent methyltransferase [Afipia felis]EKS28008.1 hypothetical protein HMPREF9697_00536 [Afipia felis ATCC 53690]SUU76718.1 Uncharacterized protein conserved in bacteria [Afipia felis]SUU84784.1 Uncharacterized protein conserved in bacteria [Afipia felis]
MAFTWNWFGLSRPNCPQPLEVVQERSQWEKFLTSPKYLEAVGHDANVVRQHCREKEWTFTGYSKPAERKVEFSVDLNWGGQGEEGSYAPNLREQLACPKTRLNNRQRLIAALIQDQVYRAKRLIDIYFMEEITPIYNWARSSLKNVNSIVGSEYLGPEFGPGEFVKGVHHEDVHNLSYRDASFDLIVSNDVFEHIPSPPLAFKECHRVLRTGGEMIMTTPFFWKNDQSICRAAIGENGIQHHLPAVYHGNPMSAEGSLVFYDFGWDILEMATSAGFSRSVVEFHHAPAFGHLTVQPVFRFSK